MNPFRPEPLSALRARSAEAILTLYDPHQLVDGTFPSSLPQHIFDTENGLRLVISREIHPDVGVWLHVSCSHSPVGTNSWTSLRTKLRKPTARFASLPDALRSITAISREITGLPLEQMFSTVSPGGIVHIFFKWDDAFLERADH